MCKTYIQNYLFYILYIITAPPKLPMETPRIRDSGETAMLSWFPARIPAYAKKTPITYIIEIKARQIYTEFIYVHIKWILLLGAWWIFKVHVALTSKSRLVLI